MVKVRYENCGGVLGDVCQINLAHEPLKCVTEISDVLVFNVEGGGMNNGIKTPLM